MPHKETQKGAQANDDSYCIEKIAKQRIKLASNNGSISALGHLHFVAVPYKTTMWNNQNLHSLRTEIP